MPENEKLPRFTLGDGDTESGTPDKGLEPDQLSDRERQEAKLEKLSSRITFITIIIPCLIGALIVISYLDTQDRMVKVKTSGTSEVQTIAEALEKRIMDAEETANQQMIALNKRLDVVSGQIAELSKSLTETEKQLKGSIAAKADTRTLEAAKKEMAATTTELKNVRSGIEQIVKEQEKSSKTAAAENQNLKSEIAAIRSALQQTDARLADLDRSTLSGDDVATLVEKNRVAQRTYIDKIASDLDLQMVKLTSLVNRYAKPVHETDTDAGAQKAYGPIVEQDLSQ